MTTNTMTRLLFALTLMSLMNAAWAQSFDVTDVLPAAFANMSMLQAIVAIMASVILMGLIVSLGFGGIGAITDIFQSMTEARIRGDWGQFFRTLALIIGVVIVAVFLGVMFWGWLSTIEINPSVTIGN